MANNFDPVTGQPIANGGGDYGNNFDPVTGQPIANNGGDYGNNFDPVTGQPIANGGGDYGNNFDPVTGQPVNSNDGYANKFDPVTGEPVGGIAKKGRTIKRLIPVFAAVLVLGVVAFVVVPRIIGWKNYKILLAIQNTIEADYQADHLRKTLFGGDALKSGKCTVNVDGEGFNVKVKGSVAADTVAKKASVDGSVSYGGATISGTLVSTGKELKAACSELLGNDVLVYNYTEDVSGYLYRVFQEAGIDPDKLNEQLTGDYDKEWVDDFFADLKKTTIKNFKTLKFTRGSKKSLTVNGKTKSVAALETVIDEDIMENWIEAYKEVFNSYAGKLSDSAKSMDSDLDIEKAFDELERELKNQDALELAFYITGRKLACIEAEGGETEIEVDFEGGKTALQNITVKVKQDGETHELKREVNIEGDVEDVRYLADGASVSNSIYNYKSGQLSFSVPGVGLKGNLLPKSGGFVLTLDELYFYHEQVDLAGTVSVTKGASIAKVSGDGKVYELNNMDEDEFEDLFEDIKDRGEEYMRMLFGMPYDFY